MPLTTWSLKNYNNELHGDYHKNVYCTQRRRAARNFYYRIHLSCITQESIALKLFRFQWQLSDACTTRRGKNVLENFNYSSTHTQQIWMLKMYDKSELGEYECIFDGTVQIFIQLITWNSDRFIFIWKKGEWEWLPPYNRTPPTTNWKISNYWKIPG